MNHVNDSPIISSEEDYFKGLKIGLKFDNEDIWSEKFEKDRIEGLSKSEAEKRQTTKWFLKVDMKTYRLFV